MTNFERLQNLKTPEEITYVHFTLQRWAIYAEGRLLLNNPIDFLAWLNKETDNCDDVIFNMQLRKCPKCGSLPTLKEYIDGSHHYQCYGCGYNRYNSENIPRSELEAKLQWNY